MLDFFLIILSISHNPKIIKAIKKNLSGVSSNFLRKINR